MSLFTENKWYLVSPISNGTWNDSVLEWYNDLDVSGASFYRLIYKLKNPIDHGVALTNDSWEAIDIEQANPDLSSNTGYWVYVEQVATSTNTGGNDGGNGGNGGNGGTDSNQVDWTVTSTDGANPGTQALALVMEGSDANAPPNPPTGFWTKITHGGEGQAGAGIALADAKLTYNLNSTLNTNQHYIKFSISHASTMTWTTSNFTEQCSEATLYDKNASPIADMLSINTANTTTTAGGFGAATHDEVYYMSVTFK